MKLVSKVALASALALGAPALFTAVPAVAQKKEKAPKLQASNEFRAAFGPADAAVKAKNAAAAEPLIVAVEGVSKSPDELFYAAQLRYELEGLKQNRAGQAAALDKMIQNPNVPATVLPSANFMRGRIANQDKQYAPAIQYLTRARQLGLNNTDVQLQLAVAYFESGNAVAGAQEIDGAIKAEEAAGRKAPEDWYKFATSKLYHGGKKAEASTWLMRQLAAYPSATAWRSAILIYLEQSAEKGQDVDRDTKIDLYRLLRANKALAGESDYWEYADATAKRGLPWETLKVVAEARAAGKGSSPGFAQLEATAKSSVAQQGSLAAEEKTSLAAATGKAPASTGDAYLASGEYAKAVTLYRAALSKGGVDANMVNTRLGIALALSGQKAEAKTAFAAVTSPQRAEVARFWSTWVDQSTAPAAASAAS